MFRIGPPERRALFLDIQLL